MSGSVSNSVEGNTSNSTEDTRQLLQEAIHSDNLVITQPVSKGSEHHRKVDKNVFMDKVQRAQKNAEVQNLLHDFSWEERYEWMNHRKMKGTRFFRQKKFQEAQEIYLDALLGLTMKGHEEEKLKRMEKEMQIPILTNIAQCLIELDKPENAIEICNRVLEFDKYCVKALCKRGTAHKLTRNFDASRKDYQAAHRISKANNDQQSINDIVGLFNKLREAENKEKRAFSKMFESGSPQEREQQQQQQQDTEYNRRQIPEKARAGSKQNGEQILRYNDDLESLREYGVFRYPLYPLYMFFKFVKKTCSAHTVDSDDEIKKHSHDKAEDSD